MIDDHTLAAAREFGRRLSVLRGPVTVEEAQGYVKDAAEIHGSSDLDLVEQLGFWLAEQLIPIRREGEGTIMHHMLTEITEAIREARVAQAMAEKPKDVN